MCGIVRRMEAQHEHLRRYFYSILNIPEDQTIHALGARKYVQALRKADAELTMREQDIALAAYLAGMMGGEERTLSDSRLSEESITETAPK